MKTKLLLISLSMPALFAACTSAPTEENLACRTPDDATAAADVTITAKEAVVTPNGETGFVAWTYDGDVPGTVLRIPLGETRRIKLVNETPRPATLHFHGVHYEAKDDGSPDQPTGVVNPSCAHVYTVTATAAGVWPFHSHIDSRTELAMGMYGAIVVPDPAEAPADRDFVVFLGQLGLEGEHGGGGEEGEAAEEAEHGEGGGEATFFSTINGRSFAGAKVVSLDGDRYVASEGMATAMVGEVVRWRVMNVSPDDLHTFHIHGHRWCANGALRANDGTCPGGGGIIDNVALAPAQGVSFVFREDNPGEWMYHCHVLDHVNDGMFAMYMVEN